MLRHDQISALNEAIQDFRQALRYHDIPHIDAIYLAAKNAAIQAQLNELNRPDRQTSFQPLFPTPSPTDEG